MVGPERVLEFWLDELGPDGWYTQDAELDAAIRAEFMDAWTGATQGKFSLWLTYPSGTLAYIILTDQFPRNMFRESREAFASDRIALAAAKMALHKGWDMRIDAPARQFFYMPLMHSENLVDQERCVRLVCERMPNHGGDTLRHAKAHRQVIREFGRFPYRNAAMARGTTLAEKAYLASGGYGATVRMLEQKHAS